MMTAFAILLVLLVYSVDGNGNGSFELQKEQRFKNHVIGGGQVTTTQSEIREGNHVQTDLFTKQLVKFKKHRKRDAKNHSALPSITGGGSGELNLVPVVDVTHKACPNTNLWFLWENGTCHCGDDLNEVVMCDSDTKELSIMDCYCLTDYYTAEGTNFPVVGGCIFNCMNHTKNGYDAIYHTAPSNCASLKRQGTLCGQCMDGYVVPAYSYKFECAQCESEVNGWGLYVVIAFLPLTIFIIIILVFRVNILSPKLYTFVYAAQIISTPAFVKIILYYLSLSSIQFVRIPVVMVLTFFGIWNLDFLRVNVLPDICINAIPLHILVLDYLVAIYPMLLLAMMYTIVEVYNSGFKPFLYVWRPFHHFFARFRRQWGIQTTIMDTFVTFFLLSTTKLLSVSCDLLIVTRVYTRDGKLYSRTLYYDPSITYFGKEHLPYALMAVAILLFFIAFPTSLLLCYQCKMYRKCLVKCKICGDTVDSFVDTFQRYYKDGSSGGWDCRWFAGFFILYKCLSYFVYSISLSDLCFPLFTITGILAASVLVIVEPHKEEYAVFNIISTNLFLWVALFSSFMAKESMASMVYVWFRDHFACTFLLWLLPVVYIIGVSLYPLIRRFWQRKTDNSLTNSLPHRLLYSDEYRDSFGFVAAK